MLKKKIIIFLHIFFVTTLYGERDAFEKANILYDAHDFLVALEAYKNINDKGYAVWYNIGNSYFELGDYARALVSWKRAERHASSIQELKEAQNALAHVYSKLGVPAANGRLYIFFQYMNVLVPPLLIQMLFLLLTFLLLLYGKTILHTKRFGIFIVMSCAWVLLSILVLVHYDQQKLRGYIVTQNAQLRNGPNAQRQLVAQLKQGERVTIQQKRVGWYKVTSTSYSGWLAAGDVEVA